MKKLLLKPLFSSPSSKSRIYKKFFWLLIFSILEISFLGWIPLALLAIIFWLNVKETISLEQALIMAWLSGLWHDFFSGRLFGLQAVFFLVLILAIYFIQKKFIRSYFLNYIVIILLISLYALTYKFFF